MPLATSAETRDTLAIDSSLCSAQMALQKLLELVCTAEEFRPQEGGRSRLAGAHLCMLRIRSFRPVTISEVEHVAVGSIETAVTPSPTQSRGSCC